MPALVASETSSGTPASLALARAKAALGYVRNAPTSVFTIMSAADLLHRLRQRFAEAGGKLCKCHG